MRNCIRIGMALGAALALGAAAPRASADDIVDTAAKNGNFRTLVAAVKAAGLVDTLKGKGPFTVFAPTDAAFAKLPAGTVETLLRPENREQLAAILTYHVVPGEVKAAEARQLKPGAGVATVNGKKIEVRPGENGLRINDARVVIPDVEADNGVIHVIDRVLLPPDR